MVDPGRARRLAGRIKQIVADGLESQVKDPRLGMVTVTDVRVTGDLHDATVFYTVFGDETAQRESAAALASATGILRSEVGRQTGVRFTPTLTFRHDAVPDTAHHIDDLLAAARRADAELQQARSGASYAGDADPYRAPRDEDADSDSAADSDAEADDIVAGAGDAAPDRRIETVAAGRASGRDEVDGPPDR